MFANLIQKVTFTCPNCNTSIRFDIPANTAEISELSIKINNLECPKCKESLSNDVRNMMDAIYRYNTAAQNLIETEKFTNSKLH